MAKPIDDRTAVNAALDKFIQRQMHRTNGVISWLRDAKLWRTVGSPERERERIGGFMADVNAERCESIAEQMLDRTLAHVKRIRQLDASRRATAIAEHNATLQRDRHHEPTADQLIRAARQAANEPLVTTAATSRPIAPESPYEAIYMVSETVFKGGLTCFDRPNPARVFVKPFVPEHTEHAA